MQWLNKRLREDRGATAVMLGIMLVPLIGSLAIALDVGALYAERAQLQNGADAAALAIAQDCATNDVCTNPGGLAASYTNGNANDGAANVLAPSFPNAHTVVVSDSTRVAGSNAGAISHPFAALLGIDNTTVHATATAEWGGPGSAEVLALALSWCEFQESLAATGQHVTIRTDTNKLCKHAPSTEVIPGGFGWLDNLSAPCEATITLNAAGELWLGSNTGGDITGDCKAKLTALKGKTVLIPIFDLTKGTGANAEYRIYAFAGFTITGWNFPAFKDLDKSAPLCPPPPADPKDCPKGNSWRGIQGVFTEWVSVEDVISLGGPQLNATAVTLTQ
ncbi:TadE/TadG family type IV pilus assembly protein [Cryobacterium tagatosivorans]|uniref:Putative Flp pilus-assembly TadG-like N-terminal domain-containing protein n=1 Tax=Cryobacterium tagatosivorans TaxID=1259199 RepID=A0A4R8UE45_9MICO|nr:pilus assembly protein TadG-related protein [Cryobacterium tagatosivorans]TFB48960.1 hypothetical protein E3O23_12115 [Cryobacterium tagatosivorans]